MSFSTNFPLLNGSKRPRIESPPSSPVVGIYDRFFKISMLSGSFKNISPFVLHKALQAQIGTLEETRKLADGSLIIQVSNEKQSDLASKLTKLHEYDVQSLPHKTLNTIKGVITCNDLANCSDSEVLENLKSQGVVELFRIPQKNESIRPSATFILSFKLHQLPKHIYAGWYSLRVRPYIQNPMRCFHCQRFGHTASRCSKEALCSSCGHPLHNDTPCSLPPSCINCKGNHSPRSRECPEFTKEFEIQKIRSTERISYFDAKKKYFMLNPSFGTSYSLAVKGIKPKQTSIAIQCDIPTSISHPPNQFPNPSLLPPIPPSQSSSIPPLVPSKSSHHSSKSSPAKTPTHSNSSSSKTDPSPSHKNLTKPESKHHLTKPTLTKSQPKRTNTIPPNTEKKKLNRSNRTTPTSSNESILELTVSDGSMETESISTSQKSSGKGK